MLNYNNNGSSPRNVFTTSPSSRSYTSTYASDKCTQTTDSIGREETRRHKLKSLKINFNNVPTTLNKLGFLSHKKRSHLTANAVATEQKATKVNKSFSFEFKIPIKNQGNSIFGHFESRSEKKIQFWL